MLTVNQLDRAAIGLSVGLCLLAILGYRLNIAETNESFGLLCGSFGFLLGYFVGSRHVERR